MKGLRHLLKQTWYGATRAHIPPELNLRQRALFRLNRISMYYDDAIPLEWSDRWYTPGIALEWVTLKLCRALRAHIAVDDQCGRADHRYCMICGSGTPNQPVPDLTWS
jgi:hypothetical protein